MTSPLTPVPIQRFQGPRVTAMDDQVATEEPLEIRLNGASWQITLRTPGADRPLVLGLLAAERIIGSAADVLSVQVVEEPDMPELGNIIDITLAESAAGPGRASERLGVMNSACGVCGKTLVDALATDYPVVVDEIALAWPLLTTLPDILRERQTLFESTGGIHAAGIFSASGELLALAEDVGRHNAVDKAIGLLLDEGLTTLPGTILQISGRPGFEILQKAWRAQIPVVSAVGAPSSLAVDLAQRAGITLVGFLRGTKGNCYSHPHRVSLDTAPSVPDRAVSSTP